MNDCKTVTLRIRPLKKQDAVVLFGLLSWV